VAFNNQMHGPGSATLSHRFLCDLGNVCIVQDSTNDFQSFYCLSIVHLSRIACSMKPTLYCHNKILLVIIKGMGNHTTLMIMFIIYIAKFNIYFCIITYTLCIFPFHITMLSSNDYIHENDKVLIEYNLRDEE